MSFDLWLELELTKTCSRCSEEKPHSEFTYDRSMKDGLAAICRSCKREVNRRYKVAARGRETVLLLHSERVELSDVEGWT